MKNTVWRYWGKADPEFRGGYHAMVLHSLDVAACSYVLIESDPVLARKLSIALRIPIAHVGATVAFFCVLHDVGKLDARFQVKAPTVAEMLQPGITAKVRAQKYDHGSQGFLQMKEDAGEALVDILGCGGISILAAVCGHHGTISCGGELERDYSIAFERQDERARWDFVLAMQKLFAARNAVISLAAVDGRGVQLVAGVCAVADWVGSSTDWFSYEAGPTDLDAALNQRIQRARVAIEQAGLAPLPSSAANFTVLFPGYEPRDVQLLTEALPNDEPAIVLVEAEMGKGKTEAAFSLAARALRAGHASGIYVALPTMATSNAMLRRIEDVAPRLVETTDDAPVQIALAHGRARREPRFRRLVERGLQARDRDAAEASAVCARWLLSRKRVLLAQVGVGTVDQAMHAVLRVHHQFVRMLALGRAVVIIDEVHAYDSYMETIIEHVVHWLGALNAPVVILSATLPAERRKRLIRAWQGVLDDESFPAAAEALDAAYPLVTRATRTAESATSLPRAEKPGRVITLDRRFHGPSIDEVAMEIVSAAVHGARVAWIRNTVREAQDAYRIVARLARSRGIEHSIEHILFHARFRGCDRRRVETSVLERFGKQAPPGGRVIVATQVVEQSLDLDFDWLVSDLAPPDLLLQRSGRLHRHPRPRPAGFETPRLTLLGVNDEDTVALRFGASAHIYDVPTLWLARDLLAKRDSLTLPNDIRPLVESTYHPHLRANALALGPAALQEKERSRADSVTARQTKARQILIATADGIALGGTVSDDDEAVQALTRDGRSATVIPVAWDGEDGASLEGVVWDLNAAAPTAWKTVDALYDETVSFSCQQEVRGILARGEVTAWDDFAQRFQRFADETGLGRMAAVPLSKVPNTTGQPLWRGCLERGGRRQRVIYGVDYGLVFVREEA